MVGRDVAEGGDVGAVVLEGLLGDLADGDAGFAGAVVDLVVDVRDVADIGDAGEEAAQQADQHVVDDGGAGVADMGEVVDGGAAAIDAHMPGIERHQRFAALGEEIVQAHLGHGAGFAVLGRGLSHRKGLEINAVPGNRGMRWGVGAVFVLFS